MNDNEKKTDLATENYQLRYILDHIGAYVFTKDREGRYTFANAMVCELFGHTPEEVLGKTDECFFDLSTSNELRKNDLRVLHHGERIKIEERNIIAATGEERIYLTVKRPLFNEDGSIQGLCGISTDITERRRLEQELVEKNNLLDVVLENIDAYVYMKDRQRRHRYVNSKTAALYGLKPDEMIGRLDEELLPREMAERFALLDNQVITGATKCAGEEIVQGADGEKRYCWSIKVPLFKDGEVDALIGFSTDISEVVELKNKFHEQARIDMLTGVLTRRFLLEHANIDLKQSQRRSAHLGLILIDIDHFKKINDTYGHAFGDAFIVTIVDACRKAARKSDLIGRLGGDEFAIVIDDTNAKGIANAAARFQEAVRSASITAPDGKTLPLSISMGGALSSPKSTVDSLMAAADSALYEAKASGRGAWRMA